MTSPLPTAWKIPFGLRTAWKKTISEKALIVHLLALAR